MEPEEIWMPIPGFQGIYSISDIGRVKSHSRVSNNRWGKMIYKEKILNPTLGSDGYLYVGLCRNYYRVTTKVHRIVAKSFIPNPDFKETVNHINGVRHDNRVENLEWATMMENVHHAHKLGLVNHAKGERNKKSRPVNKRSAEGVVLKTYPSIRTANQEGFNSHSIIKSCRSGNLYKGFQWDYIKV